MSKTDGDSRNGYGEWDRTFNFSSIFHTICSSRHGYGEWGRTSIDNCKNRSGHGEWGRAIESPSISIELVAVRLVTANGAGPTSTIVGTGVVTANGTGPRNELVFSSLYVVVKG